MVGAASMTTLVQLDYIPHEIIFIIINNYSSNAKASRTQGSFNFSFSSLNPHACDTHAACSSVLVNVCIHKYIVHVCCGMTLHLESPIN